MANKNYMAEWERRQREMLNSGALQAYTVNEWERQLNSRSLNQWEQEREKKNQERTEPIVTVEQKPNTRGIGEDNGTLRPTVTTDPFGNKNVGWEFGGAGYSKMTQGNDDFINSLLNGAGNKNTYHRSGAVGTLGAGAQSGTEGTRSIIDDLLKPKKDGGVGKYETAPTIINTKTSQMNTLRKKLQQAEDRGDMYEASRLDNEIYELEQQIEKEKQQPAQAPAQTPAKQTAKSGIRQTGSANISRMLDAKDTTGKYGKGNIDLNNRKTVRNDDGSISTEESFSVNIDGQEVLLPTIINGRRVSEQEAIDHYKQTGEYLGKFNTVEEADAYAEQLHNRQDWYYNREPAAQKNYFAAPFDQMALEAEKADKSSRFSQAGEDFVRKGTEQGEYLRELAQRTQEAMNRLQAAGVNPATGWMGQTTEEYTAAMTYENAAQDLATIEEAKKAGLFNNSGDISMMNQTGRNKAQREARNYEAVIGWSQGENEKLLDDLIEEYNDWMDPESRTAEDAYQAYRAGLKEGEQAKSFATFKSEKINDLLAKQERIGRKIESQGRRLTTEQERLGQIERYNELDERYNELMDPKLREIKTEQLTEEMNRLQAQFAEQEAAGNMYEAAKTDAQINEIERQIRRMQQYGSAADYTPQQEAAAYDRGDRNLKGLDAIQTMETSVDNVYSFLSGGSVYQNFTNTVGDESNFYISKAYNGAMFMNEDEKNRFMGLYRQAIDEGRDPTEAKAFLEALQPYLNMRSRDYEQIQNRMIGRTMPVSASIGDVGAAVLSPAMALGTAFGQATGAEWVNDPYSNAFALARMQNDTEEMIANDLGEVGGFFYKGGMSMMKNLARNVIAGGFGSAASAVSLAQFFGENYYSTYQKKLEETGDAGKAGLYALVDSGISTFFEVASVEKFFSDPKDYLRYILQNVAAEASEEFFEGTIGPFIQRMAFGESEWDQRERQILDAGGYYDENGQWVTATNTNGKAKEKAMKEWAGSVLEAVGSAAISSGAPAIYGAGVNWTRNRAENKRAGNEAMNYGLENNPAKQKMQLQFGQGQNILNVLDAASKMGPETKSAQLSGEIMAKIDAGQENNIKPTEVGELVRTIISETNEQIGESVKNAVAEDAGKAMEAAGVKNVGTLKEIVAKAIAGEKLSAKEKFLLWGSNEAKELVRKYGLAAQAGLIADEETAATMNRIDEETKSLREAQDEMLAMGGYQSKQAERTNEAEEESSRFLASEEEIAEAEEEERARSGRNEKANGGKAEAREEAASVIGQQEKDASGKAAAREAAASVIGQQQKEAGGKAEAREAAASVIGQQEKDAGGKAEAREAAASVVGQQQKEAGGKAEAREAAASVIGQQEKDAGGKAEAKEAAASVTGRQDKDAGGKADQGKDLVGRLLKGAAKPQQTTETDEEARNRMIGAEAEANKAEAERVVAEQNQQAQARAEAEAARAAKTEEEEAETEPATERKTLPPAKRGRVITNGKYAFVNDVETRIVKDADGGNTAQVVVTVEDADGNTETVDIADVKAATPAEAAVLDYISRNGTNVAGNRYVTAMLGAARQAKTPNAQRFVRDMIGIRTAVYTESGEENRATNVPEEIRNELIAAAREDYQNDEENRTATQRTINQGQGRTVYRGAYFGTNAFKEAIKSINNKAIRNEAEAIGQIAREYGFDVELYYDPNDTANQGSFSTAGGIRINLAGTSNDEGAHRSALATFAHEITHWLEANSPQAYKDLRTMILRNLRQRGYRIDNEIERTIGTYMHYGQQIDMGGAIAELVAKGSEEVLLSDEFINDLKQKDQTLFGQIRAAVTELIGRIRNMAAATRSSSSRYAKAMNNIADELGRKWLAAYEEAALRKDIESSDGTETHYGDNRKFSYRVNDQEELNFLNNQNTVTTYKTMQLIDGKLYPPMAAVVAGNMEDASELGTWEKAAEHPELIKNGNKFTLNKGKGKGSLDAAYNPYMHSSNLMINDQFSGAYNRDNLVTVECEVPESELTSGYHAEFAKDSVGWHSWHTGTVAGQLRNAKGTERKVFLSRWIKPVRIVPDAEVAQHYKELLDGTDIQVPDNVVTPALRKELEKAGVPIKNSGKVKNSFRDEVYTENAEREETETEQQKEKRQEEERSVIRDENGDALAKETASGTFTKYSLRSWNEDDQEQILQKLMKAGFAEDEARRWINDVNSVAAIIAANSDRLDYNADRRQRYMKKNADVYKYSLDASTLCAKRILYQGTLNEIQAMLPNTPLRPGDLIELANMMRDMGYQTPCGICYVESKRRKAGDFTEEFLQSYAKNHPGEYLPKYSDLVSTEGLYKLRDEHPEVYRSYIAANNRRGSGSVKPVQLRTDYRKDIRRMLKRTVEYLNNVGGLRIQSFSDFETPHLIDMMQALLDMSAKGLKSQAYTKVPNFAWVFGDTGIKINLSLMGEGNGVDENGNLIFSSVEGMNFDEAMAIRNRYSKNVGTILVGMNDAHIIAAMGDDRIDFIIPFHKSGWSQEELDKMESLKGYQDYQDWQSERILTGYYKNGNPIYKVVESNLAPVGEKTERGDGYWDYSLTGTQNAEKYLELCKKNGIVPKFNQFLIEEKDGSYRLPTEEEAAKDKKAAAIRKGYWKTLIDFKMYDNEGNGAEQTAVTPNVNMEEAERVLAEYEGGADTLPVAEPVVKKFVEEYKAKHPEKKQFSFRDEADIDAMLWMESVPEWSLQTEAEKQLQRDYKSLRMKAQLRMEDIRKWNEEIKRLEAIPEAQRDKDTKRKIEAYKIRVKNSQTILEQTQEKIAEVTGSKGYVKMMYEQNQILNDFVYGRTQEEVKSSVTQLERHAAKVAAQIEESRKRIEQLEQGGILEKLKNILGRTTAANAADELKKQFHSTWSRKDIRNMLDPIILKMGSGQDITEDVEQLAGILVSTDERNRYERLEALRGLTITLGPGAKTELKAQGSSLDEIRRRLAGTGIRVQYGERSTLETDIEDLRAEYPGMPDFGNEKDALENFVSWVESMKEADGSQEFYNERLAEAMAVVMQKAAGAAQGFYMPTETRAQKQILALIDFVKGLNAETKDAQKTLENVGKQMEALQAAGQRATGMVTALQKDVNQAIQYYNTTAMMAEARAKQRRTSAVIEQLKSKQAEKILKINEEWRQLIERDKEAASTAVDIQRERAKIHTAVKRMYDLIRKPKGLQKNIPEHMQGLARWVIEQMVGNDIKDETTGFGGRKIMFAEQKELREAARLTDAWKARDGSFSEADIAGMFEDDGLYNAVNNDMMDIIRGIAEWNSEIKGKNKLDTIQQRRQIIRSVSDAVGEIMTIIQAQREINIRNHKINVEDQAYKIKQATGGKKYREFTGKIGGALKAMHKAIVSGNMTPEYFFRTIGNAGLNDIWDGYHDAENRNGLELAKAKARMAEIAEKHGYQNWDTKQKIRVDIGGEQVEMTLGQMMSLWATWKREQQLGPEMSEHLTKGGFYAEKDLREGILGRAEVQKRARRVNENDMARVGALLSDEQKAYIDEVVGYMSNEMSQLGNEASMKAYGIKMYKEGYYFPFQIWNGVKNLRSNDNGASTGENQAFHPSFSKGRMHGAQNALIIGDFTETAANHIVGMINYATMGLANENLQKVMNTQVQEGMTRDEATKRNMWAVIEEAYGQEAVQYMKNLKTQLEGGAARVERTVYDRMLSMFRKNAVAGSLSVAFQQPLSYIRAATLINPKYLSAALLKEYWKGSYQELMQHSGVAVIKDMGRFDMNAGQTAREYIQPEGKKGKFRKGYEGAAELATMLPEKMDAWTWTRMWVAVKAEQKALHPEMDVKSDEFLDMCGERFNDIMRRTQVYDSTLVRSENMRSQNPVLKSLTSFMAEPTLTLNVLADSVRSAVSGEKGGKALVAKAGATFAVSAVLQAVVKAMFTTGRNPDDDKNFQENFMNRFISNMISEGDPANLIPGYNDLVTLLKGGELSDDAMNIIGKLYSAYDKGKKLVTGKGSGSVWRDIEDSGAQIAQLFSNIPMKNVMRDLRAMWNWFIGRPYAERGTNANIIKYGAREAIINADNMLGVVLKAAGVKTTNDAYYQEAYEAAKRGDEETKNSVIDYLLTGKGVKDEKTIIGKMNTLARKDESMSAEERIDFLSDNGYSQMVAYIKELYGAGELTRKEAEEQYRKAKPKATDKDIMKAFDQVEYEAENGDVESYSAYQPLYDAADRGDTKAMQETKKKMMKYGYKETDIDKNIKDRILNSFKDGEITKAQAESKLKTVCSSMSADEIWRAVDFAEYQNAGGKETSEKYYRLNDALKNRKSAAEITAAVNGMLQHGMTADQIRDYIESSKDYGYKNDYREATGNDKVKLKQALIMVYKTLGYNENQANTIINKWK